MKYKIFGSIIFITICCTHIITSQELFLDKLNGIDIDSMSDGQVLNYWEKAREEGYTLEQLGSLAAVRGLPEIQTLKLKRRILELKSKNTGVEGEEDSGVDTTSTLEKFGLDGFKEESKGKSSLFGYDFFNNPNISFTPNLNLPTPTNYQLGPGDEILIDIWGASQNTYNKKVSKEGTIRIENIGPIYVGGLNVEDAKSKVISYLKKIYRGIGAPNSSYSKVFAEVSLVGVRTIQINIIGDVKVPGTYSMTALSTILNSLYASGGPTEKGTFRRIKLIRDEKVHQDFDIYKYLTEGFQKGDILLRDQDVIIVSPYISRIKAMGEVRRPGIYELKENESIKDLIRFFGGFTAEAYKSRLMVNRTNGEQKEIHEVMLPEQSEFKLQDGDSLFVGKVIDRYENRVSIEGAVYRPGNYQLTYQLTLKDLIEKSSGVKEDAFLERGVIYRTIDGEKDEIFSFSLSKVLGGLENIKLKRDDRVRIFSKYSLREKYEVSIGGAINNPQTVEFIEKMTLEDLIAISGGFKDSADPSVIDVLRRDADSIFETLSESIKLTSSKNLSVDMKDIFYLKPFDRVYVRYLKGYTDIKAVSIKGEVNYPGTYSIESKDERVSDLIKKAGGLSPYAFIEGVSLIRKVSIDETDKERLRLSQDIYNKVLLDEENNDTPNKKEFKIGINLAKILKKGAKSKYDLRVLEGDILVVPSVKRTVEVRGEVLAPSLIRFESPRSLKYYINGAGGFSDLAKKRKTYVVYQNGDVARTRRFLFFKKYPKIKPGSSILVPAKSTKPRVNFREVLSISTAMITLITLIRTL